MISRALLFTSAVRLSLKNGQLIIDFIDSSKSRQQVPIEDVGYVVIEDRASIITMSAINALSDNNVAVAFCDAEHMPKSLLLNLDSHSTQSENFRAQLEASLPLKKNLWQQLVRSKICNQSLLLEKLGFDGKLLKPLYMNVKSGDSDNKEGTAARIYWKELFGKSFVRDRDAEGINSLLNYGYTILRAATARALMGAGLLPVIGVFHRNRYNSYPLADDVMEPFRPFIDETVYDLATQGLLDVSKEAKSALIRTLYADTKYSKVVRPLEIGLSITCASLARCFSKAQKEIELPMLL
jgi:CRISPR-associated protein Cas1